MLKTDKNIRHSHKFYKEQGGVLESKPYIELANNFNKFIIEQVQEGFTVVLPARLGTLAVVGTKYEIKFNKETGEPILPPDWVKTKALWEKNPEARAQRKRIFHTNDHTNSVVYKYFWSKKRVLVPNKTLYSLRMTRNNKRVLSGLINDGKEYFVNKKNYAKV